jgi:ornithine cyclodeaminase
MADLLVIARAEVERLLDRDALRTALEVAFVAFSAGRADVPARIAARSEAGLVAAMPGYVPGPGLAVKLVSVFPGNARHGLDTHLGVVALFDDRTGLPLAVMDAAALTQVRTSTAAALAAGVLARADADTLAVLGAGVQARGHLEAFAGLRQWRSVRLWNRTRARAETLAAERPGVSVVDRVVDAVAGAGVVLCCTDAGSAVFDGADLAEGAHVSSVGVGAELPADVVDRADVVAVEWRGAATEPPPAGARELQGRDPATVVELGEILAGRAPGRTGPSQLTVYKSTGHAVEDVAAARLVYDAARAAGAGCVVAI